MRHVDELRALYPLQPVPGQKLILTRLSALSQEFDSEDVLAFLQAATRDPAPTIRHQALHSLLGFLPGYIRKRYGPMERGEPEREDPAVSHMLVPRVPTRGKDEQVGLRAAALERLRPLTGALTSIMEACEGVHATASLFALAHLPFDEVRSTLRGAVRARPADFETRLALALSSRGAAPAHLLEEVREGRLPDCPDLPLVLGWFEAEGMFDAFLDAAEEGGPLDRMNLAIALGRAKNVDHGSIVERLWTDDDPWLSVHCLRALETTADRRHFPFIRRVFRTNKHDLVRLAALRGAGFLEGGAGAELCVEALSDPSHSMKGQALESLVRIGVPGKQLAGAAYPLLESPSVRTRAQAILITRHDGSRRTARALAGLMLSPSPFERLEAAFCLGHLDSADTLPCLDILATRDPSLEVRLQAVKSLAMHAPGQAMSRLIPLLRDEDPWVARAASWALTRHEGRAAGEVRDALVEAVAGCDGREDLARALIYRSLGLVAARVPGAGVEEVLARGLHDGDPEVVLGALEGWRSLRGHTRIDVGDRLAELVRTRDPRLLGPALQSLFLAGDPDAIAILERHLGSTERALVESAVNSTLELAIMIGVTDLGGRFPARTSGPGAPEGPATAGRPEDRGCFEPFLRHLQAEASLRLDAEALESDATFELSPALSGALDRLGGKRDDERGPITAGVDAANLHRHLGTPEVRGRSGTRDLRSHLQAEARGVPAGRTTAAMSGRRPSLGPLLGLALPMVILVAVFSLAEAPPETDPSPAPPPPGTHVHCASLKGDARSRSPDGPLRVSDPIRRGQTIETTGESVVILRDHRGDRIRMRSDSSLRFDLLDMEDHTIAVSVERGDYMFDFRKGGRIRVAYGRSTIQGEGSRFYVKDVGGKLSIITDHGRPSIHTEASGHVSIRPGEHRSLESLDSLPIEPGRGVNPGAGSRTPSSPESFPPSPRVSGIPGEP